MNNKRKLIVGVLAFLVVMAMGYALFSETVTIGGTAKGEGNLSVIMIIENEWIESQGGVKVNKLELSPDKKSFDLNVTFDYPGSSIAIPLFLHNNGTINAYVKDVKVEGLTNVLDIETAQKNNDIIAGLYKPGGPGDLPKDVTEFKGLTLLANEPFDPNSESAYEKMLCFEIGWNDQIDNKNTNLTINVKVSLDVQQLVNSNLIGSNDEDKGQDLAFGDRFCLGTECFNVISTNEKTVTALAAKPLDVNTNKQSDTYTPMVFLHVNDAPSKYWLGSDGNILEKYNPSNIAYDTGFMSVANVYPPKTGDESKAIMYSHMVNYKNSLLLKDNTSAKIRLLNLDEFLAMGCSVEEMHCNGAPSWFNTPYGWYSGTVGRYNGDDVNFSYLGEFTLGSITQRNLFGPLGIATDELIELNYGLRPVIEIPKSEWMK